MNILSFFKKDEFVDKSYGLTSPQLLDKYISNPDFPYLISFPRTGSHWLRNVMELYFEKPALVRVFYYKNPKDFTCIHVHDEDLTLQRKNIIYLYRHPVPTIYSQVNYYKEDLMDKNRVLYWANLYGRHLSKWLFEEGFTNRKTTITYENLKADFPVEFKKICTHLNLPYDKGRVLKILSQVSKEKIKKKVPDDSQVVNVKEDYEKLRDEFDNTFGELILKCIEDVDRRLITLF